jgi:hypothetical protein
VAHQQCGRNDGRCVDLIALYTAWTTAYGGQDHPCLQVAASALIEHY